MKLGILHQLVQDMENLEGPQLQQKMQERMQQLGLNPGNLYQELEMTSRYVDTHRDTSHSNQQL